MKKIILAAMVTLLSAHVAVAHAATDQQNKMKECNAQAKDKKGDDRKAFMKSCLSAKPTEAAPAAPAAAAPEGDKKTSQKDKMKTCNKDAGDKKLKGEERKKFMSECLKA